MLPDFPEIKKEARQLLIRHLQNRIFAHMGFLREVPHVPIPEGKRSLMKRIDGTEEETKMQKIEAEVRCVPDTEGIITVEEVLKSVDDVARQMAEKKARMMYQRINEFTQETGNVFDAKGQGITADLMNDMLERMDIRFTPDGEPCMPSFVCHPDAIEKLVPKGREIESDSVQRARFEEIMIKKREEFRDREANRRLVD